MKTYTVKYRQYASADVESVEVTANNKADAYSIAVYTSLEELPYSAWVDGVTYKNGEYHRFNTFEGNPF